MTLHRYLIPVLLSFFPVSFHVYSQDKTVSIQIAQDDHIFIPGNGTDSITLQQKTFKIRVLLQHTKGVYLFASLSDSLFRLPEKAPVPGRTTLPDMTMAEETFNREKELLVSDEGWSYWFYDPDLNWHRFNKKIILLDSGRFVGTKTIKQLYFLPERSTLKLKENKAPLYLFFVAFQEDKAGADPGPELLRLKLKINWRKEDE